MSPRPSRKARSWCYATDPEAAAEKELAKFRAVFPKIKPTYLRLQAGALYAKLMTERQGSSYFADMHSFPT